VLLVFLIETKFGSIAAIMVRPAIASLSLGDPRVHEISTRLLQAAQNGFQAVEIVEDDIKSLAEKLPGGLGDDSNSLEAARDIRQQCGALGLTVLVFQPFRQYEGLLDRTQHEAMLKKLTLWFEIVRSLGTDMIQVPTSWLQEGTTGDEEAVVADLRKIADMGLTQSPVVRFAYEGVAWGRYFDTWEDTWELAKKVDRPNFGLCLDTFHIAGRAWGDPTAQTGRTPHAEHDLQLSLDRLVSQVDVAKVFYVQAGDAEKLDPPLSESHPFYVADQPARMSWSRNARLFPHEEDKGGYLPIEPVMDAIVNKLGYNGWVSMELFSRELADPDPGLPNRYATRASASWKKMIDAMEKP
jgi:4-hydroxyphenylpyruvate dioxygenase